MPPEPLSAADTDALMQLCAHYGIAPDYHDLWGQHHPVAPDALQALLRSCVPPDQAGASLPDPLSLPAESDAEPSEALPPLPLEAGMHFFLA